VSTRVRSDAGFTLIEVMLAMVLMLVVSGATLATFAVMERGNARNQRFNAAQTQVRTATDTLAKRLRNLASPANPGSAAADQQPIERANANDFIFRAINSEGGATTDNPQNLQRYRYCLNPTTKRIYVQRQTWSGVMPATPGAVACPGGGWTETQVLVQDVTNGSRALFHYTLNPVVGSYSESTSVAVANHPITVGVRTTLWLDPDPAHKPTESLLSSRIFLRNQNRPPIAALDVRALGNKVTLNASAAEDPEGNFLLYQFFNNGVALKDSSNVTIPPSTSAVYTYQPGAGTHRYTVTVTDVGKLTTSSTPAVVVPCTTVSSTTTCTAP
jgi:prepilin-type N-terminal cleavage/methylation domain-containing protein